MTREILFRGKRIDNGEWITGCLVKYAYDSTPYIGYLDAWGDGIYKVDPSTVGQFTGLCDKNGKKAFSHDISIDSQGRKWVIFTCPGGFGTCRTVEWVMCNGILAPANVGLSDIQNAEWFENCHEVIGNVHDMANAVIKAILEFGGK